MGSEILQHCPVIRHFLSRFLTCLPRQGLPDFRCQSFSIVETCPFETYNFGPRSEILFLDRLFSWNHHCPSRPVEPTMQWFNEQKFHLITDLATLSPFQDTLGISSIVARSGIKKWNFIPWLPLHVAPSLHGMGTMMVQREETITEWNFTY